MLTSVRLFLQLLVSQPVRRRRLPRPPWRLRLSGDRGMSTAEYAVGMIAACGFAALLYKILTSGTVQSLLQSLISRALHMAL